MLTFIAAMKPQQQPKKAYSLLALGDSYTIGEGVKNEENFPYQTVRILRQKGFDFKDPQIIAKTGWTTDELKAAIEKANLSVHYDFVTLLIGVNNQYRGRKVADYIPEFEALLKKAIKFAGDAGSHVIVLSIPDWGVTPFANGKDKNKIAAEIDEYNAANKLISLQYSVHYLEITVSTRKAANDRSLLANDGLHPSAKEYAIWAESAASVIRGQL